MSDDQEDRSYRSYRISYDKAELMLNCVRPRIMFINGIFGTGKTHLAQSFKDNDSNVLSLDRIYKRLNGSVSTLPSSEIRAVVISEIRSYLKRFDGSTPIVIEGFIHDPTVVQDIFSNEFEIFTYVYMYPNNAKRYKDRLIESMNSRNWSFEDTPYSIPPDLIQDKDLEELRNSGKGANTAVRKLLEINKRIYEAHLEAFDSSIITVLN